MRDIVWRVVDGVAVEFRRGDRYRVVKDGAKLGHIHVSFTNNAWSYTAIDLLAGTVLECAGRLYSGGSDGVDLVGWTVPEDLVRAAQAALDRRFGTDPSRRGYVGDRGQFQPSLGSLWSDHPDMSYLERLP